MSALVPGVARTVTERRPLLRRLLAAVSVVVLGAAGITAAGAAAGSAPRAAASRWDYPPNVLPQLPAARLLGAAPPGAAVHLLLGLSHPDPAGEERLAVAEVTPGSPDYQHWLTPAGYAARFGVPAARVTAAVAYLRSGGLGIDYVAAAGDVVAATGTVAQVSRLFAVPLNTYRLGSTTFTANAAAPRVPAALGVVSVVGLNTLQHFSPPRVTPAATRHAGVYLATFDPQQLWTAYDMPPGDLGQGARVGVFMEGISDSVIANLRVFEIRHHLPRVPVRVVHTGPGPFNDNSGGGEWDLDTQSSTGMAPDVAQVSLYVANSLSDAGVATEFSAWANDPAGPPQMNASFGECETDPLNPVVGNPAASPAVPAGQGLGNNLEPVAEPILRAAFLEGRTLFSSSGDTGSSCPVVFAAGVGAGNGLANQGVPLQNYPAASRWTTAVGGTVLALTGANTRSSEDSWAFTGGGSAVFVNEPTWQKAVSAINRPCLVDAAGGAYPVGTICRGVPDLAALSGNSLGNGYNVTFDMQPSASGGTSLSSPLTMGMWARVQAASTLRGGVGPAAPLIYRLGTNATTYARDFYDVTGSETGTGNGAYQPARGWDYTSGFGVMDVAHVVADVDHRTTAVSSAVPNAPLQPVAASSTVWTTVAGNAFDPVTAADDPALDLTRGTLALAPDRRHLIASLRGPGLGPSVPASGTSAQYYLLWTYRGTTYFAQAAVDRTGAVTYSDGHAASFAYTTDHTITGTFGDGLLTMTVPLSDVGSPPVGARLLYPYGLTQLTAGAALALTTDTGGGQDDVVLLPTASAASAASAGSGSAAGAAAAGAAAAGATAGGRLATTGVPAGRSGAAAALLGLGLAAAVWRRRRAG